jgi:hypothetical protein
MYRLLGKQGVLLALRIALLSNYNIRVHVFNMHVCNGEQIQYDFGFAFLKP